MFKKIKDKMTNKKGFTLVELIVVLVILAILAAILVPSLLGYINKARQKQYVEEAHSIYTAIQVLEDEKYAAGKDAVTALDDADKKEVNDMVLPTEVTSAAITLETGDQAHAKYIVKQLTLNFKSQNGKTVTISMSADGTWSDASVN